MIYCTKCGKPFDGNFCPACGTPAENNNSTDNQTLQTPVKRKKRHVALYFIIPIIVVVGIVEIAILIGLSSIDSSPTGKVSTSSYSESDYLAFDEKTWGQFGKMYEAHNNLIKSIGSYDPANAVELYSYLEEAKAYFQKASGSFNYGKTEEEKTYLSSFSSWAICDQMVAESMMKYLDSLKTSDLNEVKKNIDSAKEAVETIAGNRGILLVKAGLTDKEIKKKVEADMKKLDQ